MNPDTARKEGRKGRAAVGGVFVLFCLFLCFTFVLSCGDDDKRRALHLPVVEDGDIDQGGGGRGAGGGRGRGFGSCSMKRDNDT